MSRLVNDDLLSLSIPERLQLVEDLWDSIAMVPESVHLTDDQKIELDRRLDDYHNDPSTGAPRATVFERIRKRK